MANYKTLSNGETRTAVPAKDFSSSVSREFVSGLAGAAAVLAQNSDFTNIYPAKNLLSPELGRAHDLLTDLMSHGDNAASALEEGRNVAVADGVNHLIVGLRELFLLRGISDGFAIVVNGTLSALENLKDGIPSRHQLAAVRSRLRRVRTEPWLSADQAEAELDLLESADLVVEAPGSDILLDWTTSENV